MDKVEFGAGLPGYVAGAPGAPGLVVIQEWWGINGTIRRLALKYAEQGFRCLVPDLYKGKIGVDAEEASHLMTNLDFKAAISELGGAVAFLRKEGSNKVGVVGFCMGGALAFCAAEHSGVDAAVPFYGTPDPAVCDPTAIRVPMQAHFGKLDAFKGFADEETATKLAGKMKAAGVSIELCLYDGAGHAFMNGMLGNEGAESMKLINAPQPPEDVPMLAFDRSVTFLKHHLV